jgi:hypothetical protein
MLGCLRFVSSLALFCLASAAPSVAAAASSYSIISGTVFQQSGFALPEAQITLEPEGSAAAGKKTRKLATVSSPRGEFTFRVPPVEARYKVTVTAKGFATASKIVETHGGEERVEATFTLAQQSK